MSFSDLVSIVLITAGAGAVVGGIAFWVLRASRRTSTLLRLMVIVGAAVATILTSTVIIASEMYISQHDLVVQLWVIGVGAAVSLAVAALIGTGITRAGMRLLVTARAIGDGQVVPAEDHAGAEFTTLSHELSLSSQRLAQARREIEQLDASRRRLIAWISHDLRTPLAAIGAMAESLEDGVAEDPVRYHRQIRAQAETLASMVDDLFELSKIQSGLLVLHLEPLSLFDLVSDAVADLQPLAAARSVTLRESGTGNLTLYGDARELTRVVGNLIVNAIQHSPADSEILISAGQRDDDHIVLSVTDSAGGIPEADLAYIFDPGWRGSASRTPPPVLGNSSGAGLGLAIVRGIVEAHGGGVSVSNITGGSRFDVTLPRFLPSGG